MTSDKPKPRVKLLNFLKSSQCKIPIPGPGPLLFKQIPAISRLLRNNPDRIISRAVNIFV